MSMWRSDTDEETLPATNERTYLSITPADEPLDPRTIETSFERLHQLEPQQADTWLPDFLTGTPRPTIEWLLVATADTIEYAVGIDPPELTASLEHVLRDLFPTAYELTQADVHPAVDLLHDADPTTAVEFYGTPERSKDWQTRLTPFSQFQTTSETNRRVPLSALVETLATTEQPTVVQVLAQPLPDWTHEANDRHRTIREGTDTRAGRLAQTIFGHVDDYEPSAAEQRRLDELDARNARRSFVVNVRAVQSATNNAPAVPDLQSAFGHVGHTTYEITGHQSADPGQVHRDVQARTLHRPDYDSLGNRLPLSRTRSRGIVADPSELGSFCLVDGSALTGDGKRAIAPTHGERTSVPSPPAKRLDRYRTNGLTLGRPITQDGTPTDDPIAVPPALQPLHTAWFGKTGSGKSTALVNAILDNHAATDGADILIDPKGDGLPTEYMRAHYERYGQLDDVVYFDCERVLPAFSFFDIREDLDAGIARSSAVEDRVEHYVEILAQIMGPDRFHQAVRSPDIIRYLTKALFDPVSGDDAFSHRELHRALQRMHDEQRGPPVSDEDLERMLAGVASNRARTFDEIMQGVANRIEKIPVDPRLARIFNHVPDLDGDDPHFDFEAYLDEDVVVIIDTGELRSEAQRAIALVVLSNLWSALRRRANRQMPGEGSHPPESSEGAPDDLPLVNCYVEEASSIAVSSLLSELLATARGFGCSMTVAMQFPAQLREASQRAYDEVLNNISTVVTGNVAVDDQLAQRLATADMSRTAVGNRLRALWRGEWFVSLPAGFDETEPRPFLCRSLDPPRGHPASETPPARPGFEAALRATEERVRREAGVQLVEPSTPEGEGPAGETDDSDEFEEPDLRETLPSPLETTQRMPPTVEYVPAFDALRCSECTNRYDPSVDGMERAVECCSSLDDVDRDDIPICELNLKLTPDERETSELSDRQLMFLQAVYNGQQMRYDPLEYDLLQDSMIRLQEYVGLGADELEALVEADLLRHNGDYPHRLYTVTPAGRKTIGESYRKGVDYGHGKGDLEESSLHVLLIEVGRRYLVDEFQEDPDSPVERVVPYYELEDEDSAAVPASTAMRTDRSELADAFAEYESRRLDIAGLDGDENVVVAVEAERVNNDIHRAVPEDFDKMADCDVEEAIWLVVSQSAGQKVLSALNDPPDGDVRVEKTYSDSTPPQQFNIDEPGLTAVYPVRWVQNALEER